jgi:hypothetical protein
LSPFRASSGPHKGPPFRTHEGGVDETLAQIEFAAVAQVRRQRVQDLAEHTAAHPVLEAAMTRRRRRVPIGHVLPRRAGAQHPENTVEHFAVVAPRAAPTIGSPTRFRDQRCENGPLFVLEFHRSLLDAIHDAVREASYTITSFVR